MQSDVLIEYRYVISNPTANVRKCDAVWALIPGMAELRAA
jgi:hypothetical protein